MTNQPTEKIQVSTQEMLHQKKSTKAHEETIVKKKVSGCAFMDLLDNELTNTRQVKK